MNSYPDFGLAGQVALVTGAARGLGNAIARALAHAGADVALGLRDVNAQGDLVAQIEAMGRRALPLQMNMTRLDEIFQAVRRIRDTGMTVLIVEQRMAECLEIADRAYILQTGRVLMQGAASEIKGNPDVRKAYLGL